ncbi:hypothetical protein [Mucisphaera sp.]|uniref:hypothetical protein n=1 Tax=Mucisphaera sp. TaxID=2913024 RepID=UPI003D1144DA
MVTDPLQEAWRVHGEEIRVAADTEVLLRELRRNQRYLDAVLRARDYGEVRVGLLLIPVWFALTLWLEEPLWTWYLAVPGFIWLVVFMLVFRFRYGKLRSGPEDSLIESVRESVRQIDDQVWLLRHVWWWYLLPLLIPMLVWTLHLGWALSSDGVLESVVMTAILVVFLVGLDVFVYRVNQSAVRHELEPRRKELLALLASLEGTDDGEDAVMLKRDRRFGFGGYLFMVLAACLISALVLPVGLAATELVRTAIADEDLTMDSLLRTEGEGYPRLSPFEAIIWGEEEEDVIPTVKVDGVWYFLGSIDAVPIDDLVAFSRETFGDRWQKRIDEDLVEVMSKMGHAPGASVRLGMVSVEGGDFVSVVVVMTEANRQAIWRARRAAEEGGAGVEEVIEPEAE